jgi:hypothetical protein
VWFPKLLITQQLTLQNSSVGRKMVDISGITIFREEDEIIKSCASGARTAISHVLRINNFILLYKYFNAT